MDLTKRHEKVTATFLAVCEVAPDHRASFLDDRCKGNAALRAEVEAMLRAEELAPHFLEPSTLVEGLQAIAVQLHDGSSSAWSEIDQTEFPLPDRIGLYVPIRVLARGGTAVVYLAQQDNPRRKVALKVLLPGVASESAFRRLEHEAHFLARLQHPGIAQVFDAGIAQLHGSQQPFFVMEFVDGKVLTQFAKERNLSTRERLELLICICDAVAHAHQNCILHRDLKPSNILVDSAGKPKVLDFGIARATDADVRVTTFQTDIGQLIGTIPYMSPEQTMEDSNALDIRSDVYALGVVSYELLVGRMPYNLAHKPMHEAVRIIREVEPEPPSAVSALLRGDLETIILKAIEKERDRRYQNVSELAADFKRYLHVEPILARPASAVYQIGKFARRNRALVWGAAATLTALLGGIVGTTVQAVRATRERDRATELQRRAMAQSQLWLEFLKGADSWSAGTGADAVDTLLDRAEARVAQLGEDPLAEASMRFAIGEAYRAFGATVPTLPQIRKAHPQLRQAFALRQAHLGATARDTLEAQASYVAVLRELASLEDAFTKDEQTLRDERLKESDALLASAFAVANKALDADDPVRLGICRMWALRLNDRGEPASGESLLHEVLRLRQNVLGNLHPHTLESMGDLASVAETKSDLEAAEQLRREILKLRMANQGADHEDTNNARFNLANLLWHWGKVGRPEKLRAAVPLFRTAIEVQERSLGRDDVKTLMLYNNFAVLLEDNGELDEAEAILRENLEIRLRVLGPDHGNTIRSRVNLAGVTLRQGRAAEAGAMLEETLEIAQRVLSPEHVDIGWIERNYGDALRSLGRMEEAEIYLLSGYAKLKTAKGEDHAWTRGAVDRLITLYDAWGKPDKVSDFQQVRDGMTVSHKNVVGG